VAAVFLSFRKMYVNEEQGGEEQIISSEFVRISICQKNSEIQSIKANQKDIPTCMRCQLHRLYKLVEND